MVSKSKGKKVALALLIVFVVLSAVLFFIALGVTEMGKLVYDESNTIECTATCQSVAENEKKSGYLVEFEEYDCNFQIVKSVLESSENIERLKVGTTVTFRIYILYEDLLKNPEAKLVPFVTMRVGESEIVTFESSNRDESGKRMKVKIGGCVFAVAFLAGAGACIIKWVKLNKKQD